MFHAGFGKDVITDFTVSGSGGDQIDLHGSGAHFLSFDDLIKHFMQDGDNAVLNLGHGSTLTLDNVDLHTLTMHDFVM